MKEMMVRWQRTWRKVWQKSRYFFLPATEAGIVSIAVPLPVSATAAAACATAAAVAIATSSTATVPSAAGVTTVSIGAIGATTLGVALLLLIPQMWRYIAVARAATLQVQTSKLKKENDPVII